MARASLLGCLYSARRMEVTDSLISSSIRFMRSESLLLSKTQFRKIRIVGDPHTRSVKKKRGDVWIIGNGRH